VRISMLTSVVDEAASSLDEGKTYDLPDDRADDLIRTGKAEKAIEAAQKRGPKQS